MTPTPVRPRTPPVTRQLRPLMTHREGAPSAAVRIGGAQSGQCRPSFEPRVNGVADTKMIKSVGEHFVCGELARRGWAPALTRDGLERTDILAVGTHLPNRPTIELQVKTATGGSDATSWPLGRNAQQPALSEREWFVLVLLPPMPSQLRSFVVPRDHVAAAAWIVHMAWLTDPSAAPGMRNAPVERSRVPATTFARYEGRWDLLDASSSECPILLPPQLRTFAKEARVGLPPGHPWHLELPAW
jgi:hypothetical protein